MRTVGAPCAHSSAVADLRVQVSRHRGRNGLIIASVTGSGAGFAVGSRHPASETTEGIVETLMGGRLEALLGWRIGRGSEPGRP